MYRHIRNILADKECIQELPQILCMTEKLLNSSIKQPLRVSRNTILFADAISTEHTFQAEINSPTIFNWPAEDRQRLIDILMARYHYLRAPLLRRRLLQQ